MKTTLFLIALAACGGLTSALNLGTRKLLNDTSTTGATSYHGTSGSFDHQPLDFSKNYTTPNVTYDKNVTINITVKPAPPPKPSSSSSASTASVTELKTCSGAVAVCCNQTIEVVKVNDTEVVVPGQKCTYPNTTTIVVVPECTSYWDKLFCNPCSYCAQKAVVKTIVNNVTLDLYTGAYPPAIWTNTDGKPQCTCPQKNEKVLTASASASASSGK